MADEPNKPNRPVRPRQGAPGSRRKRRGVIEQGNRPRQDSRQARGGRDDRTPKSQREVVAPTGPVSVHSGVTVRDFSQALGVPAAQLIKIMMGLGKMVQITQSLADEEVELIAAELEREVTIKHAADEDEAEPEVYEDA
jgi:translation initiation factor IF-2